MVIHIQGPKFLASHSMMSKVFFFSQQPATFTSCEELSCPQGTPIMPPNLHLWCSNGPCRPRLSLPTKDHSHPASFEKENPGCHSTSCTGQWKRCQNNTDKKPHFQFISMFSIHVHNNLCLSNYFTVLV